MIAATVSSALVLLVALLGVARSITRHGEALEACLKAASVSLGPRVAELEVKVEALPKVWSDHDDRIRKAAERVRYATRRLEEIRDGNAPEPESDGLPIFNGGGSEGGGMLALPGAVAPAAAPGLEEPEWRRLARLRRGY